MKSVKMSYIDAEKLYVKAHMAGMKAFDAAKPTPMVVGQAKSLFSNEIDYSKGVDVVEDGVCGMAAIYVRPARGTFVKFCKDNNYGSKDEYQGGFRVRLKGRAAMSQSYTRKVAYAQAFAGVLQEAGIDCWVWERLD